MRSEESPPKSTSVPNLNPKPKVEGTEQLGEQRKLKKSAPKREGESLARTRLLESPSSQVKVEVRTQTAVSGEKVAQKSRLSQLRHPVRYATETKEGCNCRRTACLKMLCACFSKGQLCSKSCSCEDCQNLKDNMQRSEAIDRVITKDPQAFSKPINPAQLISTEEGCKCRHSSCIMKYCKCFAQGKTCSSRCVCESCKNTQERSRRESRQHRDPSIDARKLPKKKPKPEWKP